MIKRKYVVVSFLAVCFTVTLLIGATTSWTPPPYPPEYSPWVDSTGPDDISDGTIGWQDLFELAGRYGTTGTPVLIGRQGNISVPAAAFVPRSNTYECRNYGGTLYNYEASTTIQFYAAVQLPHGATVTNFTTYWYDAGTSMVYCFLDRRNSHGAYTLIASAHSTGDTGWGSTHATYIYHEPANVDNNQYGYTIEVDIPSSASHTDYQFHLAIIEYEYY